MPRFNNADVTWTQFERCNYNRVAAFEEMCDELFYAEILKKDRDPNKNYLDLLIEELVLETTKEDGSLHRKVALLKKYFLNSVDYSVIRKALQITVVSYRNELDDIYIFCNQTMNRASKVYKEAEKIVTEAGMTLHTVTNNELLSLVKKNKSIAEFYFSQRKIKEINYYENRVTCISFSPDGRSLASGSSDKTVRIRDLKNDSERKLGSHDDEVRCVSYSSDGRYLASGSYDKTIRVWNLDSGTYILLKGHKGMITSVSFSPDGRYLASGSYDKTIRIWDLASMTTCRIMGEHNGIVTSVSYSPDGRHLASGSEDRRVLVWHLENGSYQELKGHTDAVTSVSYSPDGRHLASGSKDRRVVVWDLESASSQVLEGHLDWVNSVVYILDGKLLASVSDDCSVRTWSMENNNEGQIIGKCNASVTSVSFSPNGKQLACSLNNSSVWMWDVITWRVIKKYKIVDYSDASEETLNKIQNYLYRYCYRLKAGLKHRSFNIMYNAERFYTHLINMCYGWELELEPENVPFDAYDRHLGIILEITSSFSVNKAIHYANRISGKAPKSQYKPILLFAGEFEKKSSNRLNKDLEDCDIWFVSDIYNQIESLPSDLIEKIFRYCEAELSPVYIGEFELKVNKRKDVSFEISSDVAYTFHITQLRDYVLEFPNNYYCKLIAKGKQKKEEYAALFEVLDNKNTENELIDILSRYGIDDGDTILINLINGDWLQYRSVIKGTFNAAESLEYQIDNDKKDLSIIDLSSSNTNDKSLRLLTLKIIDKGKELCNIRFVANDKHMLTDQLYSTVIIGINGVGKSFALKGISDVLNYMVRIREGQKNDGGLDYGQYELQYYLNGNVISVIVRNGKISLSVNNKQISLTEENSDKYLPSRILASSFMVNDKFKYTPYDAESNSNYIYLGVRKGSNATFTSQLKERIQENIELLVKKSRFSEFNKNILPYLGFESILIIRFNFGENGVNSKSRSEYLNLRGVDLSKQDLSNVNLSFADLSESDMHRTNLKQALLDFANMQGMNLSFANLYESSLRGANLRGADLSYAGLKNANLYKAELERVDFYKADLRGADFRNAVIKRARFDYANLAGAKFEGALLKENSFNNVLEDDDIYFYNYSESNSENETNAQSLGLLVDRDNEQNEMNQFLIRLLSIAGEKTGVIISRAIGKTNECKVTIPLDSIDDSVLEQILSCLKDERVENIDVLFRKDGKEYSLNELSSGELNILYTFSNIFYWIEHNSLVLIDEPDISLHPEWQMRYVSFLKKMMKSYKGCHFIMATHSHYIVSDLEPSTSSVITITKQNGERSAKLLDFSTYAWSAENILYNVFNVRTTRNYYFEKDLHELLEMVNKQQKEKIVRIKELCNKLNRYVFDDNDPLLIILNEVEEYINHAESK